MAKWWCVESKVLMKKYMQTMGYLETTEGAITYTARHKAYKNTNIITDTQKTKEQLLHGHFIDAWYKELLFTWKEWRQV